MNTQLPPGAARQAHEAITAFLASAREPMLLEPGEPPLLLEPGGFSLESRGERVTLSAWDRTRNLTRRVVEVKETRQGKLALLVERFGKRAGQMILIDAARPFSQVERRRSGRLIFREAFRQSLGRQFPDWRIAELSAEANLEQSLSPSHPRALLVKGAAGWAALAARPGEADSALTFGLIWLDYLRRRERRLKIEGLTLFVAMAEGRATGLRVRWLDSRAAQFLVTAYDENGEQPVDPRDCGNLDTQLSPRYTAGVDGWAARLTSISGVEAVELGAGTVSFRVRGLEFARLAEGRLSFGLDARRSAEEPHLDEIRRLAGELARMRAPGADTGHPLWLRHPEAWLESRIRGDLQTIDATLRPDPVYTQAPCFAGGERGVIDLLAVDHSGRLTVLELKATEDLRLPVQALDYWMRVKWHLDRGEFPARGYFPGIELRPEAPRLLLIAPALQFHPSNERVLRYFSPEIGAERIGLGSDWRRELRVMFRLA